MKKNVLISDLTGLEATDPVLISFNIGTTRYLIDADKSDEIVVALLAVARQAKKRGRPKTNPA